MKGDRMKWIYTFVLLGITLGWAIFTKNTVLEAIVVPDPVNILEASGTSVLLGALIVWNGNVNQFWFRKKPPVEEKPAKE